MCTACSNAQPCDRLWHALVLGNWYQQIRKCTFDVKFAFCVLRFAFAGQQFVDFDRAQFQEIQEQYSPDLYWLDAGWVGSGEQFLPLSQWAKDHRKINPQQLWVNRDNGVVEDYLTPENPPPQNALSVGLSLRPKPWEVCIKLNYIYYSILFFLLFFETFFFSFLSSFRRYA